MFRMNTRVLRMNTPEATSARLAAVVSEAIRDGGVSQRKVSEETGIPLSTLSSRLTGRRPFTVVELAAIAQLLEISVLELVLRSETRKTDLAA